MVSGLMEGVMADFADLGEVMASRSGDDGRQAVVETLVPVPGPQSTTGERHASYA